MSIEINNESGMEVDEAAILRLTTHILDALYVHPDAELDLQFVDVGAMEQLHVQWMNEPGPTDVLSFPMDELRPGSIERRTPPGLLGDLVICPQVAQEQARAARHSLDSEVQLLVTHGLLHLLGFDHHTPEEEAAMFGLQSELLTEFGRAERGGASNR